MGLGTSPSAALDAFTPEPPSFTPEVPSFTPEVPTFTPEVPTFTPTPRRRYYYEPSAGDEIVVRMITAEAQFGFEYLGNSNRLVVTSHGSL